MKSWWKVLKTWLSSQATDFFNTGIQKLMLRYKCLNSGGDYVEKQLSMCVFLFLHIIIFSRCLLYWQLTGVHFSDWPSYYRVWLLGTSLIWEGRLTEITKCGTSQFIILI
jgi:hypothetical protein